MSKTGKARKTAVAPQIAASLRYAISQRLRKRIEEGFGWSKAVAGLTRVKARGLDPDRTPGPPTGGLRAALAIVPIAISDGPGR